MENKIKVDVFTLCWNEMDILPFAVDYWKKYANHVTVYDNGSTDGSVEFLEQFDFVTVKHFDTGGKKNNDTQKKIKNDCWKGCDADLVVVCDIDEFILGNDIIKAFKNMLDDGATLCAPRWYTLISEEKPEHEDGKMLHEIRPMATPLSSGAKTLIFSPKKINAINYGPGSHSCRPNGQAKYYTGNDIFCLHVSHNLSLEYKLQKYKLFSQRRSDTDKRRGYGTHYMYSEKRLQMMWDDSLKHAVNLKEIIDGQQTHST